MTDYPEPTSFNGDDDRDSLSPHQPPFCESCGVGDGEECLPECGCAQCRTADWDQQDVEQAKQERQP